MQIKIIRKSLALLSLAVALPAVHAQSVYTASRKADLQAGGGYSIAKPDTMPNKFKGFYLYFDLDFKHHLGIEGEFRKVNQDDPGKEYEKTYEIGPRYYRTYKDGLFRPYIKGMYGRGVYNFQDPGTNVAIANLAYNIMAAGGGLDIRANRRINVRVFDYEYQNWFGYPPHGITPQVVSFGVAYHFGSDSRYPTKR
ncbi:porin family protein [Terriglobus albidus]|uniref:porin family protein n=1 Tax=Terriglobus albidus TaxID=1592106 RepID=UPI0021DF84D7|nr:porin family protein [Terriglobus albidus]